MDVYLPVTVIREVDWSDCHINLNQSISAALYEFCWIEFIFLKKRILQICALEKNRKEEKRKEEKRKEETVKQERSKVSKEDDESSNMIWCYTIFDNLKYSERKISFIQCIDSEKCGVILKNVPWKQEVFEEVDLNW